MPEKKIDTIIMNGVDYKITDAAAQEELANKIPKSEKGAANGVATLDDQGKIPAEQLPGYVDEIVECDNRDAFPPQGETGKIYVAKDTGSTYRWSGSMYVEISSTAPEVVSPTKDGLAPKLPDDGEGKVLSGDGTWKTPEIAGIVDDQSCLTLNVNLK